MSCWFRCRCGEDTRAPTVAVRVVFVMVQCWFPMVQAVQLTIEILKLQLIDKVFHVPVRWLCKLVGPCTQVHSQGFPRHQGGKGWRGRRELAPRCSATRISCIIRTCQDRLAVS